MHFVVPELAFILHTIQRTVLAIPVFQSMQKLAFITRSIQPRLEATASFFILVPLAFVHTAVDMEVLTETVSSVLIPLTLVAIAVGSSKGTIAMSLIVPEVAFVFLPIWARHHTLAMSFMSKPLTFVYCAFLDFYFWQLYKVRNLILALTGESCREWCIKVWYGFFKREDPTGIVERIDYFSISDTISGATCLTTAASEDSFPETHSLPWSLANVKKLS
mmetsp:Transcript_67889/g.107673  ORF Transcript_67889/g.107673 Transcript_67889/m.107673 type:complete len:219 (+) Transcript_67889:366-1022(+)